MKSPGHKQHPEHKVKEIHIDQRVRAEIDGEPIADSRDVVKVEEDGSPARYYFPRGDVRMEALSPSNTTTQCPFKGTARYFSVQAGGRTFQDAIWTYEEPYEEHAGLKDRVAFYTEKHPSISLKAG